MYNNNKEQLKKQFLVLNVFLWYSSVCMELQICNFIFFLLSMTSVIAKRVKWWKSPDIFNLLI